MVFTRRQVLGAVAVGSLSLAGCTGDGTDGDGGGEPPTETTSTATATATDTQMDTATGTSMDTSTEQPMDTATEQPMDTATATPSPTSSPTESTVATTVQMKNTSFKPRKVEVDVGATVKWTNEDSYGHDVTAAQFHDVAADWSFSKTLSSGGTTTYTFDEAGVYEYYCTIHGKSQMCGVVLVGDATLNKSLPCGGGDDGPY